MFNFLLVLQAIVTLAMITVILMQRSEGGGLGIGGGSPSGLMSARGAADFLTRATTILATLFVVLSIVLGGLASINHSSGTVDTSLQKTAPATAPVAPTNTIPLDGTASGADPFAEAAKAVDEPKADSKASAPAPKTVDTKGNIPIAQ